MFKNSKIAIIVSVFILSSYLGISPAFATPPIITSVNTAHADGSFTTGEIIDIMVTFDQIVDVVGGPPTLALNSGGSASYISGTGTNTLMFRYTVGAGENSADLDYSATSSLALNDGTIKNAGAEDAVLTLPAVGTFAGAHAIVIDTTPPAAPTAVDLTTTSDSGSSPTDNITNDNTPNINGDAETGSHIKVYANAVLVAETDATSPWNVDTSALTPDGTYGITATATDAAGNTSPSSSPALSVMIDTTAPAPTPTIVRSDPGEDASPQPERTFSRSVSLETDCGDGLIGSGCATFVVGGTGITNPTVGPSESFDASRPATLTAFRDAKAASISDVTDNAGNVAPGPFSDTIALDPRIVGVIMSDDGDVAGDGDTPYWDVNATFTGTVENIADPLGVSGPDTVTFDFGSPTIAGNAISDLDNDGVGTFSVTDSYPKISTDPDLNPHSPSAKSVNFGLDVTDSLGAPVTAAGPSVTVQRHPTSVNLRAIDFPNALAAFSVIGEFVDDLTQTGVSGKLIALTGNGVTSASTVPPNPTTGGLTISAGMQVNSCIICSPPEKILRAPEGTVFTTSTLPRYASLSLRDMGTESVTVRVTSGVGTVSDQTATADALNIAVFTLGHPAGIASIEIFDVTNTGVAGISRIRTFDSEFKKVLDISFTSDISTTTSLISFGDGTLSSVGVAQSTSAQGRVVTGSFAGDTDYEPSANEPPDPPSNTVTYNVAQNPAGNGFGGSVSGGPDSQVGITSIQCAAGNDDDGDALCDNWEGTGAGIGIPFVVRGTTYYYTLPGSNSLVKDIYAEIDYMAGHIPLTAGLNDVVTKFDAQAEDIQIHYEIDDSLTHVTSMAVWRDLSSTDLVDNNDFTSLKSDFFGRNIASQLERPTVSAQTAQTNPAVVRDSEFLRSVSVGGITLSTPNTALTSGDTQGNLTIKVRLTTPSGSSALSASGLSVAPGSISFTTSPSASLNVDVAGASAVVERNAANTRLWILTIKIPFSTTDPVSSQSFGVVRVQLNIASDYVLTRATEPGSPFVQTTLLNARAQAYRYYISAHSIGGASGAAENRGNDAVIALGSGFGGSPPDGHGGSYGTQNQWAGTFMHETGHLLNLAHGGPRYLLSDASQTLIGNSNINCKPNYISVMSYARQLDNFLVAAGTWRLDYSRGLSAALDEALLVESAGLSWSGSGTAPTIAWGNPGLSPAYSTGSTYIPPAAIALDWNPSVAPVPAYAYDITNMAGCGASVPVFGTPSPLLDANDWSNLDFNFRQDPSGQFDGFNPPPDAPITSNEVWQGYFDGGKYEKPLSPAKASGDPEVNSGSNVPIKFRLTGPAPAKTPLQTPVPPASGKALVSRNCDDGNPTNTSYQQFGTFRWIESGGGYFQVDLKTLKTDAGKRLCIKLVATDTTVPSVTRERVLFNQFGTPTTDDKGDNISTRIKVIKA